MKSWVNGLLSALFSGMLVGLGSIGISPEHFNFSNTPHIKNIIEISVIGGIVGLLNYLRRSPLP